MIDSSLDRVLRTTKRHLQKLEQLGVTTVRDFLQYFPRTYNDTSSYTKISEITTTEVSTIKGQIKSLFNIRTKYNKKITRGTIEDDTGKIDIVWFNQPHLTRLLPRNRDIVLTGRVKYAFGKMTLQSPSYELLNRYEEQIHSGRIVPVYHETEGISSKWIREKLKPLVDHWLETIEEFIPEDILKVNQLIEIKKAVKNVHFPDDFETLEKSRERLAFNELFLLQLKVLQKKWYYKNSQKKK